MGFATRCTSCNTVFRVVQDQLKVSEGWVRCGRCHEVFDAQETLFVLEAAPDATPASSDAPPSTAGVPPASGPALDAESGQAPPSAPGGTYPPAPDEVLSFASDDAAPPAAAAALAPDLATPSPAEARAERTPQMLGHVPDPPAPLPDPQAAAPASGLAAAATPAPQATDGEPGPDAPTRALEAAAAAVATPSAHPAPAGWSAPVFDAHSRTGRDAADDTPASRLAARDRVEFEDARFNSELFADDPGVDVADPAAEAPRQRAEDGAADAASTPPHATPEFLRRAERNARWNRPTVVVAMVLVCGVLLLALAAQAVYHFRDLAAASWPQLRPALLALCDVAGCRIEPVRRIEEIVIESSALTDAPSGDAMRLSVVLRNRSALPLAMPAIELALTDAAGQMLARRALLPADFGKPGATLPAGAETPLQLVLAVDGRRPSGYTVEPFYP